MTRIVVPTDQADQVIREAADILCAGGLVGLPTETVYGLAANALDGRAVARIFEAKGRPQFNPLIIHCHSLEQVERYTDLTADDRDIATRFWPGPLTLILRRKPDSAVSDLVSAGLPTLAVRIPAHPVAQALLKVTDFPLAAPSANPSGTVSPTTPEHVAKGLGDKVDLILAAGKCAVGLESTILDLTGDVPLILRTGAVTAEEVEEALGKKVSCDLNSEKPRAPGQLLKHYAPSIPVRMNAIDVSPGEALLAFGAVKFMGIKGGGAASSLPDSMRLNLSEQSDLHEAAANLFAMLRQLDRPEFKGIAVMSIPETGLGVAINDRLRRATER